MTRKVAQQCTVECIRNVWARRKTWPSIAATVVSSCNAWLCYWASASATESPVQQLLHLNLPIYRFCATLHLNSTSPFWTIISLMLRTKLDDVLWPKDAVPTLKIADRTSVTRERKKAWTPAPATAPLTGPHCHQVCTSMTGLASLVSLMLTHKDCTTGIIEQQPTIMKVTQ